MTRLLILTALALAVSALAGCKCCGHNHGGCGCETAPCDPCDGYSTGEPYLSAPVVTPGTEVYAPGPG